MILHLRSEILEIFDQNYDKEPLIIVDNSFYSFAPKYLTDFKAAMCDTASDWEKA